MGRRGTRFSSFAQKKRDRKEKAENEIKNRNPDRRQPAYETIIRENLDFEKYYKAQKICTDEEWPEFLKAMKSDLPTAFRITGSREEAATLLNIVKENFFKDYLNEKIENGDSKGEDITELKPYCLPWYPDGLAWQLQLTRKDIRRSENYFKLHNFLISETDSGNISRQEAVSMIPPIALDIKSHHKVLDMCAAPGSKTAQLIEMLHQSVPENEPLPKGFVIANDSDNNRCYMLVHQAKRLNSPCMLVSNHDATIFPNLTIAENLVKPDSESTEQVPLKFDRILCDVPCSGDGTLRKNPDIWLKWNAANGDNLHGIQIRIIRRAAELLAVGGKLVYSTCSLNPVENEAVIHRLLSECGNSVRLLDPREMLPNLKHKNGMTKWLLASKDLQFYENFDEVPEKWHTVVRPQMFPPKPEDLPKYSLEKCMRILPHQQDTGAFFIAVIEKVDFLPWETIARPKQETKVELNEESTEEKSQEYKRVDNEKPPPRKKRRMYGFKEDPFVFFNDEEEVWPSIKNFYDIHSNFNPKCLLTRCQTGKKKNIYFCSEVIRDIVLNNEHKLKIINTGVKSFVRCDNKNMECAFRLGNEGLQSILPFLGTKRIITIEKQDLITILLHNNPLDPPDITTLTESTQNQVANITAGSCALKYLDEKLKIQLNLSGWKGTRSLRAYVTKFDTVHILRLLGEDTSKYEVNKFKKLEDEEENSTENGLSEKSNVIEEEHVTENGVGEKMDVKEEEADKTEIDLSEKIDIKEEKEGDKVKSVD